MLNMILKSLVCRTGSLVVGNLVVNACGANYAGMEQTKHGGHSMQHPSETPETPPTGDPGRPSNANSIAYSSAAALAATGCADGPDFTGFSFPGDGLPDQDSSWLKQLNHDSRIAKASRRIGRSRGVMKMVKQGRLSFAQV